MLVLICTLFNIHNYSVFRCDVSGRSHVVIDVGVLFFYMVGVSWREMWVFYTVADVLHHRQSAPALWLCSEV